MKKTEQSYAGWYFLIATVIISAIVFTIKPDSFIPSMNFFLNILKKIIPIFILVFVLMVIVNLFVSPKRLIKYLGKNAGIKGWLIAMGAGIISTGPIYMWYPMLNDMQKKA